MATFTQRAGGRWQAKIRRLGWPSQSETFQTRAAAEAWARHIERAMDTESFLPSDDAARTTFAQLVERYQNEKLPKLRGQVQDQYLLKRVAEAFGEYSLARITPAMLSEYRDTRLKAVKEQTVAHELGMVSRLFNAAILDWKIAIPKGNPVQQVRKPSISNDRDRRLEGTEEQLLLDALLDRESPWPHAAAVLAIETAARMSELLALRWAEIDLDVRVARVRGKDGGVTKGGDLYRDVPLTSRAAALLKDLPRSINGLVLPISQNALQIAWGRALRQARKRHVHGVLCQQLGSAGYNEEEQAREVRALVYKKREPLALTRQLVEKIETEDQVLVNLHFHDLRHEATSRLAEKLAMHELMKITGHKSSRMLARYYHPRAADLARKLA
ncbi:site-specific integrase [Ramlibacter sp. WS9]|uniref:tyrosine-type recombinase/integrase n=1 Tax=Ramlibacter sp. WS9 TaxID=1882741 RepID=UPI00114200A5|nr:site-specific integrase [Ramlibacter sp. WS9]ROZ68726.1 site-specific integrase [Ramlibacter sp. WS9]